MKTVLITGVAGFIGSNLAAELLVRGYRVLGVDNFDDTYDRAFKEQHVASLVGKEHFALDTLDIRNAVELRAYLKTHTPQYVVHLAAKADTRQAVSNPYPYLDNNITGTINLFEAIKEVGSVENTVFASSSSVYGNDPSRPWNEEAKAETPLSPYGATKRAGELFAHAYHHNFGMPITCVRFFNAYGEHNRPNMVPYKWGMSLLNGEPIEISGTGERKRGYTYIGDTVAGTIAAMEQPLGFEVLNIGSEQSYSLNELLAIFERATGQKADRRSRESHKASVEETQADSAKAKKLLGWEPKVGIEEGVQRLVEWLKKARLES